MYRVSQNKRPLVSLLVVLKDCFLDALYLKCILKLTFINVTDFFVLCAIPVEKSCCSRAISLHDRAVFEQYVSNGSALRIYHTAKKVKISKNLLL